MTDKRSYSIMLEYRNQFIDNFGEKPIEILLPANNNPNKQV